MTVKDLIEILLCHNMEENVVLDDNGLFTNNFEIVIPKKEEKMSDDDYKEMLSLIEDIIENFEFKNVHKYMEAIDWGWHQNDGSCKTPTIPEMKETVRYLLADTYQEFKKRGGTEEKIYNNGFQATVGIDNDGDLFMKLEFIAEDMISYSYEK